MAQHWWEVLGASERVAYCRLPLDLVRCVERQANTHRIATTNRLATENQAGDDGEGGVHGMGSSQFKAGRQRKRFPVWPGTAE